MARTSALSKLVPRRGGGAKAQAAPVKRGRGRPPGSKNKTSAAPARRGRGRPPGSKNKVSASGARKYLSRRIINAPQQIRDQMRKGNPPAVRRKAQAIYMRIYRRALQKQGLTLFHGIRRKYKSPESKERAMRMMKKRRPYAKLSPARIKKMQMARKAYLKTSPTAGRRVGNKHKRVYRPAGGKK